MDFKHHLKKYLNEEQIESLINALEEENKNAVLLNVKKISDDNFKELYPYVIPHPIVKNAFLYDKNEYQLGKSILHELGAFYLQEPSAMVVSSLLDVNENDLVLDLCAAPGGKSIQLSYKMNNKGLIISNDISHQRANIIKENMERLGIGNILCISNDFSTIYDRFLNTFDKIILDVPCSGSGMFRKNDLMKDDWSYNKVLKFQAIQKEIIHYAYKMLKPGGIISYSTCSFSYEEDEEVILDLLKDTDAEVIKITDNPLFYTDKSGIGVHLFPFLFPGEGHYICHIKKPGALKQETLNQKIDSLIKKLNLETSYPFIDNHQNMLFIHDRDFNTKYFSIIRYGVKVGELLKNNEIKYDLHYARFIDTFSNILDIDEENTKKYLRGEALNISYPKGYILLRYQGVNIDIAKSDTRIIKNRYPKYLINHKID